MYLVDHPLLAQYHPDFYTQVVSNLCQEIMPSILLLGQTDMGRDLAPRLAAQLGSGLSMDCIELNIDPEKKLLVATRPVYGGNALAIKTWEKTRPQIATVRPKSYSPAEPDNSRQGEIVNIDVKIDETTARIKIIDRIKEEVEGIKLEDAEVVVTGGRGIGGKDGFKLLHELARLPRGAVGGTRAACEEGWKLVPEEKETGTVYVYTTSGARGLRFVWVRVRVVPVSATSTLDKVYQDTMAATKEADPKFELVDSIKVEAELPWYEVKWNSWLKEAKLKGKTIIALKGERLFMVTGWVQEAILREVRVISGESHGKLWHPSLSQEANPSPSLEK